MQRYCRFTKSTLYYYKTIRFHPLIPEYLECRCKNGKMYWIHIYIMGHEHIQYPLKDRQEVRQVIEMIKEKYDDIL